MGGIGCGTVFNTVGDNGDGLAALFIFKEVLSLTLGADISPFVEVLVCVDKTVGDDGLHVLSADLGGLILIISGGTGGAGAEVGVSGAVGSGDELTLVFIMDFSDTIFLIEKGIK